MPRYPQAPYIGPPASFGDSRTRKTGIAIHATANTASDTNEAQYATHRGDDVSSHFYVDADSVTQSLDTDYEAWHAGSELGNSLAISVEITGQIGWSYNQWMASVDWPELVALVVWLCRTHGIPATRPTIAQMRESHAPGIYTHNDMRLAWGGTDHTDPGPGFPMDHLLTQVRAQLGQHPTTSSEDDMPQFQSITLKDGYGAEFGTVITIPPSLGGANWGQGWLSFGADFGAELLRVAVHNGNSWEINEITVSNATGRVPWRGDGKLPKGSGVISVVRVRTVDGVGTGKLPVAALVEFGAR